jgi:hypothetical protein
VCMMILGMEMRNNITLILLLIKYHEGVDRAFFHS